MEYIVSSNEFFLPEWNKIEKKKRKIRKKLTEYQYFSFAILSGQIINTEKNILKIYLHQFG